MNDYIIRAGETELDTFDDISVSLNYQIDDILDIEKRNTNFSKTIVLPGTSKNNLFFKQIFDVNIDNINFNPNVKIPASIEVGNNTVMLGNLQLLNIKNTNSEITYEVAIFGELKNIINNLGDYTLKNLDLSEYNHTRDKDDITDSWEYNIRVNGDLVNAVNEGRGYVYPYIINGNSSDIYDKAYIYDLFPAVYLKTYIDKIFEFANFTYSSNFFNSSYFKKIVLPFTGDKIQLDPTELNERKVITGVNGDDPDDTDYKVMTPILQGGNTGNSWYWNYQFPDWRISINGTGFDRESGTVDDSGNELTFRDDLGQFDGNIFTCSKAGKYDLSFRPQVIPKVIRTGNNTIEYLSGEFEYYYEMRLQKADGTAIILDSSVTDDSPNGTQEFTLSSGTHGTYNGNYTYWYDLDSPIAMGMSAKNVFMSPGDKVYIGLGLRHPSTVNWAGTESNYFITLAFKESLDGAFSVYQIKPSDNQSYGNEPIDMNTILSDMKMKDLFLDIVKTFNLVVKDNPEKPNDLIIEPRDDFYKSKQKVKDWTQILDRQREIKITPMSELDARTYLYTYTPDDDLYNKEYTAEIDETYGQLEVTVLNDFSNNTQKTQSIFSPTPCSDYQLNGRVAPFFTEKDDEGLKPKKVKPRMLFYSGLIEEGGDLTLLDHPDDLSGEDLTSYPYVGMWDNPFTPTEDLGFGTTDKIYWSTNVVPQSNLYNKFHKATLKNITDKNARLLEGYFYLTPKDIADFDFRDIILIDGSYWRVNSIKNFDPIGSDKLTRVVLYKLIDLTILNPFTVELPDSNRYCPNDVAIFQGFAYDYYYSISGQNVTQACCDSLGGNWVDGVCRVAPEEPLGEVPADGALITSGYRMPSTEPNGTLGQQKDNNSQGNPSQKIQGSENYVSPEAMNVIVVGDKNSVGNVDGVLAVGDGNYVNESGIYVNGVKITEKGIQRTGLGIADGGEDIVFPFDKTNLTDVADGTQDAVLNPGGVNKTRQVIDGTIGVDRGSN